MEAIGRTPENILAVVLAEMIRERWDVPRALNYYKKRSIPRPGITV